ncbi:MAG: WG repeat-containing protein [Defluviitaleaceae bacterium]|nr:WG repeat-containing protein [Defluviitaleaceae bacterium]
MTKKSLLIIFGGVIIIALVVVLLFPLFFRTHSSFSSIQAPHWGDNCRTYAGVRLRNDTIAIVNVETGREVRRFRNNRHRRYSSAEVIYEGIARVSAHERGNPLNHHTYALIDFHIGKEIIPFGMYHDIVRVVNNMAIVSVANENNFLRQGVINIETGEQILPYVFNHIFIAYNRWAVVQYSGENLRNSQQGIIDLFTGEEVVPIKYRHIFATVCGIASISLDGGVKLMDLHTMEVIVPFGEYLWIHPSDHHGFAVVQSDQYDGHSLVKIDGWQTVVPFGVYDFFYPLSSYTIMVYQGMRDMERGVLRLDNDDVIIFEDGFQVDWDGYSNGLVALSCRNCFRTMPIDYHINPLQRYAAILDTATGEKIVPLGIYDRIFFWNDDVMVVRQDGFWRFEPIPR